ncbi:uncharacterized protein LOC144545801 isoform X2 [Carex rostrata]
MVRSGLVPVFVDTSLDTHLAIAVSPNDTVASVKRKFVSEHEICFPEVGQINIEALTTRWQGKEYRLSETLQISVVLQMEGDCFLKALVATQLRHHTDTDKQQVVCFAGPTEVINTSIKKKKKRKRNIASFEDTTTLRPTQSRKVGEEELQGHGGNRPPNDSYCDAKDGESRKAETNDASIAVCEAEYIKEEPLCSEKAKGISGKNLRHDSESPEIPGPAKKKAKNDDAKKKVVTKDGDIIKKDGSLLEVTQTIGTVVLTEEKKKERDRTKTKGPCSELPSEVKHKPQIEDRNQVRPDTDTDNQPVVCFAGPTEAINTSLKKKKKCKRNASFEDPTTLGLIPTQQRTEGEEELQGKGIFDLLDSFRYTGTWTGSRRRRGGGLCWIPSLSVISKRKPTPSPLKCTRPTAFSFAAENTTSAPVSTGNVKKVRKSRKLAKANASVAAGVVAPPQTVTVKKKTTPFRAAEKRLEAYRRVPPDFNFKPLRSCHHLIQEDHTFDHWRVLVICMFLNMTTGKQVKKIIEDFFSLCPDADTTTKVDAQQIENVICTLGLQKKRAKMIKRLSEEYLSPDWTHVTSLHGIGK